MDRNVLYGIVGAVAYFAFLGVIIYFAVRWSRRMMEKRTRKLRDALAGAGAKATGEVTGKPGLWTGLEHVVELNGQRVALSTYAVSRDYIRVNLRVPRAALPHVWFKKERGFDRFGKAIGLNHEVQTGDQAFDDAIYINSREGDLDVQRTVESDETRGLIKQLVDLGYSVELSDKGVEVFQIIYALKMPDTTHLARAAELAAKLSARLPSFDAGALRPPRHPKAFLFVIVGIMVPSFIAGLIVATMSSRGFGLTMDKSGRVGAMAVGGAVYLVYLLVVIALLRGRSNALGLVLMAGMIGAILFPLAGASAALHLNQALDKSEARVEDVTVTRVYRGSVYAGGDRYQVSYRPKVGDVLRVKWHDGAFGWRWTETVTP